MDLSASTLWWMAAGILVALEVSSGTFYLLMLALGCAAGAVAAHAGLGGAGQVVTAALVGGGATAGWHLRRARNPRSPPAEVNRNVNIDIGETVEVSSWAADGTARVSYRGAAWTVRHAGDSPPAPGRHTIVAVHGSHLSVAPLQPS
jgi:membrane protein implicated in regulation of membrane protease activity